MEYNLKSHSFKMIMNLVFCLIICMVSETSAQFSFEFMQPPITDTVKLNSAYDFIIIGAGSGGCVMANRLSENPEWKVLLLEVGDEESDFLTDVPLTAAVTVLTSTVFFFVKFLLCQIFENNNHKIQSGFKDTIGDIVLKEIKTRVFI